MIGDDRIAIELPAAAIFAVLADGELNVHWRTNVVSTRLLTGDGGVGTEWQMERLVLGRPRPRDYVVVAYERATVYAIRFISGRTRGTATYTLTEKDGVTDVALHLSSRATGMFRLIGGTAPREMASDLDDLQRLRAYLESRGQEAASPSWGAR